MGVEGRTSGGGVGSGGREGRSESFKAGIFFRCGPADGPSFPTGGEVLAKANCSTGGGRGGGGAEEKKRVWGRSWREGEASGSGIGQRAFEHHQNRGVDGLISIGGRLAALENHVGPVAGDENFCSREVIESSVEKIGESINFS